LNPASRAHWFNWPTSAMTGQITIIHLLPNTGALEMLEKIAGNGVDVDIYPRFIGGFIRSKPGL